MIIVTGVGRCGTSLIIKYLKELGLDVGSDQWNEKIRAGLENAETCRINNAFRNKALQGKSMRDFKLYLEIEEMEYGAVKDPQFLVYPEIIEHWWYAREDLKIIYCHRDPAEVVASQKRSPEMTVPAYRCFPDLIEKKQKEFLEVIRKSIIPMLFVDYKDIDFNKIASFSGINTLYGERIWEKLFSPINYEEK